MPGHGIGPVSPTGPDPFAPPATQFLYQPQPSTSAFVSPVYTGTAPAGTQLFYSSAQYQSTVAADNGSTLQVYGITGLPQRYPYKLLLEWGTANQEVVIVTSAPTGNGPYTFTGVLRGQDGGGPQITHSAGAQVNHGVSAADFYGITPVFNPCDTQYAGGADPTGTIDCTNAINAAIVACGEAGGGIVGLPPGTFAHSGALVVNYDNVTLMGTGWSNSTQLTYLPGAGRVAAIIVGLDGPVNSSNVLNLSVNAGSEGAAGGNLQPGSGHGIVFRSETGTIQNVTVTVADGDGFHLSMDALTASTVYDVTMFNCYAEYCDGDGLYIDPNFYNCEFTVVKCEGANQIGSPYGGNGFNIQGSYCKFLNCHAYYCNEYGANVSGASSTGISFIGGEYETNTLGGINVNGAGVSMSGIKIIGVDFYGNAAATNDIAVSGVTGVTIEDCFLTSALTGGATILVNGSGGVVIADNIIDNSTINVGVYVEGSSTYVNIHHNYINTVTTYQGQSVVITDGSTYCDVGFNTLSVGASESGGNYNRIYGNIYTGGSGAGQFSIVGANSLMFSNTGTGASTTSSIQQSNYAATSAVTVTAASIASLGSMSVIEGDPVPGAVYKFTLHGTLGTAASAPTYILDVRWGGTGGTEIMSVQSTATANAPALGTSLSARPLIIEGQVEFVTSSTCVGWLRFQWLNSATATTAANWITAFASITSPVTVTVSSSEALSVDWTWSATGTGTTITIASSNFERVA